MVLGIEARQERTRVGNQAAAMTLVQSCDIFALQLHTLLNPTFGTKTMRQRFSSTTSREFEAWSELRLKDRIRPDLRVLFVGINPGVRSAITGHHFAGYSNRFWKLLSESGLTPEPITYEHDDRLPEWGLGITNLIARPTPGIDDLDSSEYINGWKILDRKIRRYRPEVVALVGVTLFRAILPLLDAVLPRGNSKNVIGPQPQTIHGARIFVLPNPSGRNANYSYGEMLKAFVSLRQSLCVSGR